MVESFVSGRAPREAFRISKQTGRAFTLEQGEFLRVIDPEGEQVADLVAFGHPDQTEVFSTAQTRDATRTLFVSTGDSLYAASGAPLLVIVADDVGRHDLLFPPCRPESYRRLWNQEADHPSCLANLSGALAAYGVSQAEVPLPFNIFLNCVVHPDGRLEVRPPLSKPGDSILFRAEQALLVGMSACPVDKSPCNGFNPSPIDIEIYASEDAS